MGYFRENDYTNETPPSRTRKRSQKSSKRSNYFISSEREYNDFDKTLPVLEILARPKIFITWMVVAAIILALDASCAYLRVNSCSLISDKHITVNGSTAFAPLVQDVANEYRQQCLGANVSVNGGNLPQGSLNGIGQVEKGTIDIGTSDVFANPYQNPDLQDYQVAVVVFAIVTNKSVDVDNLSTDQIRRIYSGDITNWQNVGGKKAQDIVLISRPNTSGTRATFEKYILGQIETISGPQSLVNDTSDTVAQSVKKQSGAIGYVSLYYAKKYDLKILSIDGQKPAESASVENDTYKFWNIEHMYTKGVPGSPVKDFVEHMFSRTAKQIIRHDGYLDPGDFSQNVLIHHLSQA